MWNNQSQPLTNTHVKFVVPATLLLCHFHSHPMQLRIVLAFLALSLIAHASLFVREHTHESVKHSRLARRAAANSNSNVSPPKRCKPRTQPSLASTTHSTKATVQPTKAKATSTSVHHATASSSAPKPPSSGSTSSSTKSPVSGLLQVTSPVCGPSGATSMSFLPSRI